MSENISVRKENLIDWLIENKNEVKSLYETQNRERFGKLLSEFNKIEELIQLEELFKENGYSEQQIEEIKHYDNEAKVEGYIENLQEELSYWGS